MEERKEDGVGHLPSNPTTAPYLTEFLQGAMGGSPHPENILSQDAFPPGWVPRSEEVTFPMGYSGWSAYGPAGLDLGTSIGGSNEFVTPTPYGALDEYMTSLSQPDSEGSETNYLSQFGSLPLEGYQQNMDFSQTVDSGRSLYSEAMGTWNEYSGKTYDPFGHADVFHDMDNMVGNARSISPPVTTLPSEQEHPFPTVTKPSYSDVAKNKPSGSGGPSVKYVPVGPSSSREHTKKPSDFSPPSQPSNASSHRVPYPRRPRSASGRQHGSRSKTSAGSPEPHPVRPDSKYGLDNFEELGHTGGKDKGRNHGGESGSQSRKGSTSSMSSSSSAIDDIYLSRPPNQLAKSPNPYDTSGPGPGVGLKYDSRKGEYLPTEAFDKDDREGPTASKDFIPRQSGVSEGHKKASKEGIGKSQQKEKPFFDPKRIFQSKPSHKSSSPSQPLSGIKLSNSPGVPKNDSEKHTVLNNRDHGKPKTTNCNMNKSSSAHYINNDLRQSHKQTNMEGCNLNHNSEKSFSGSREGSAEKNTNQRDACKENVSHHGRSGGASKRKSDAQSTKKAVPSPEEKAQPSKKVKRGNADQFLIVSPVPACGGDPKMNNYPGHDVREGEVILQGWHWIKWGLLEALYIIWNLLLLTLKLALLLILLFIHYVVILCRKVWRFVRSKIPVFRKSDQESEDYYDWSNPSSQTKFRSPGLDENIPLPTTGDEAMKRLLACRGKDPYSILGLRVDASDDDIKKYYRRQAVLVHPDKNHQPGAEEAFKILGHAFDIIGEPEKRMKYDGQRTEAQETEAAMQQFADLLSKLHEKIQEAANMMRCDNCGGKHRRVPVERAWYDARFCDRCNMRHSAKEGDVWAESSVMGFLWHYYACMEGKVFDITDWARCQGNHFKHIQANAHHVIYRIATNAGRQQGHQQGRNNEADLEDFINHLFHKASRADGTGAATAAAPQQPRQGWNANTSAAGKKKRKKKRH